jgi:hypothetical protein
MSRLFIIGGVTLFLIILVGGGYLFLGSNQSEDLNAQSDKLQTDLTLKRQKLAEEQRVLDGMTNSLRASYPLGLSVQEDMRQMAGIAGRTDFLFTDVKGVNPQLIVTGLSAGEFINQEKRNINLLLADWRKLTELSSLSLLNIEEIHKVRQEAEIIKTFVVTLTSLVNTWVPDNSGLSQLQIDSYVAQLPSVESINQVLVLLDESIVNSEGNPIPPTPTVAPSEVVAQQNVVIHTEAEVANLEQQLAALNNPPVVPPVPTINPNLPPTVSPTSGRTINTSQGIIIQPGPPRLIPSTDPF